MNAAVLKASQLLSRLCERVLEGLKDVVAAERLGELTREDQALREETSWWFSSELKEAYYVRWGEYGQDLVEFRAGVLKEPGEAGRLGNWEKQKERLEKYVDLLAKHLRDEESEAALKAGGKGKSGERKDKVVSDVDPEARRQADAKRRVKAGYKTHLSMDRASEIVTALIVTPMNAEDGPQLLPLVAEEERRGLEIEEMTADTAYSDGSIRAGLAERAKPITVHIPEPKGKKSKEGKYTTDQIRI